MSRLGNTSVSSLISGANSARARQTAINDAAASYAYDNSQQTSADAKAYTDYLSAQKSKTTDTSKAMAYDKKINEAQRSYASNESQRATDAVNTGEGDYNSKMQVLQGLYGDAKARGDENAAQNIASSMITLSKTAQAASEAAQTKSDAAAKKAFNTGMSEALTNNKLAQDTIQSAMLSGKGLSVPDPKDPTGKKTIPVTITQDANGNSIFAPDPKGKGLMITADNYAQSQGQFLQQKAAILQQAITAGMDETGTHQEALAALQNQPEWQKYVTGPAIQRANDPNGTPLAFTTVIHDDGSRSVEPRKLQNATTIDPKTGKVGVAQQYGVGLADSSTANTTLNMNRKVGNGVDAGGMNNFQVGASELKTTNQNGSPMVDTTGSPLAPQYASIDPESGKGLFTIGATKGLDGKGNSGIFNPGLPGTIALTQNDLKAGHKLTAADYLGAEAGALGDSFAHPSQAVHGAVESIVHPSRIVNDITGAAGAVLRGLQGNLPQQVGAYRASHPTTPAPTLAQSAPPTFAAAPIAGPVYRAPNVPAPVFNYTNNRVQGAGAPATPVAQTKALNTVGTPQFTQSLFPQINLGMTTSSAPQVAKNWWQ